MMREVIEAQPKSVPIGTHDIAKRFELFRLAIGREAHHLVLIAEFQKAQILRDGTIEEAQRMRKRDRAVDLHAAAFAGAPHRAREIPKAIRGKQRGPFEW